MDAFIGSTGYFSFLILLCVLIFVHELGHYAVARFCGVRVETFSIGFGKEIAGWTDRAGTRWKIGLIPFGGYVKMYGERGATGGDAPGAAELEQAHEAFGAKKLWQKSLIVAAGPAANFLFAIVILGAVFATVGEPRPGTLHEEGIGFVSPGSAADTAGFQVGDRILSVDGRDVADFEELRDMVLASGGKQLRMEVIRDGRQMFIDVVPRFVPESGSASGSGGNGVEQGKGYYVLGVGAPGAHYIRLGVAEAAYRGVAVTGQMSWGILSGIGEMFAGERGLDELGGPVKMAEMSKDAAQVGFMNFLFLMVVISVNLGLLNLLPIPVLDGGHLVFYAIEAVRGRPVGERAQEAALRVGLAILMALMVFVTFKDILSFGS